MKEKVRNEWMRRPRKLPQTKLCIRNLSKEINIQGVPLVRYSGQFFKWKKGRNSANDPKNKEIDDDSQPPTGEMTYTNSMYQEKKEQDDSPTLKIT